MRLAYRDTELRLLAAHDADDVPDGMDDEGGAEQSPVEAAGEVARWLRWASRVAGKVGL